MPGRHDNICWPMTAKSRRWQPQSRSWCARISSSFPIRTAGGGYGDPALRDPLKVQLDVKEGWITRERARRCLSRGPARGLQHRRCNNFQSSCQQKQRLVSEATSVREGFAAESGSSLAVPTRKTGAAA